MADNELKNADYEEMEGVESFRRVVILSSLVASGISLLILTL
eukprot:CAMPEP_0176378086 /NCGR_PEP_ID=MMETSP0126-20121128/29361_1 /TAXON_ID=141414 ORGANISM="Strombidinopsis acuminatum, Strain SPMC142" /NCGR_SAMPLE_ID=MMETSP0126 /ASSEMBLY_ACC=CAM_ASM_000229 /LENGTH=41 /DNA_ID= /DNA_START= /DNA_END= /DNA_ORIENTATION=